FLTRLTTILSLTSYHTPPPFVQLRFRSLPPNAILPFLHSIPATQRSRCIVNCPTLSEAVQAWDGVGETRFAGVHLGAGVGDDAGKVATFVKGVRAAGCIVGTSTHDRGELVRAREWGVDYVVFGPVGNSTTCVPRDGRGMGWEAFGDALRADGSGLMVYALGGVGWEDLARAKEAGAVGVAAIKAFWHELGWEKGEACC
ncbi:thiamine phosphate synthase superfamily, partial [Blyttiomyces helicus]